MSKRWSYGMILFQDWIQTSTPIYRRVSAGSKSTGHGKMKHSGTATQQHFVAVKKIYMYKIRKVRHIYSCECWWWFHSILVFKCCQHVNIFQTISGAKKWEQASWGTALEHQVPGREAPYGQARLLIPGQGKGNKRWNIQ